MCGGLCCLAARAAVATSFVLLVRPGVETPGLSSWVEVRVESRSSDPACLSRGKDESEAVLLSIRFRGATGWICSQCFRSSFTIRRSSPGGLRAPRR
jgi:hypothetical protein